MRHVYGEGGAQACEVVVHYKIRLILPVLFIAPVVAFLIHWTSLRSVFEQITLASTFIVFFWFIFILPTFKGFQWYRFVQFPGNFALIMIVLAFSVDLLLFDRGIRSAQQLVENPLNQTNLLRAFILGVVGLWVLRRIFSDTRSFYRIFQGPQLCFILYAFICLASAAYASSPLAAAGKALEIVISYVLIGVLVYLFNQEALDIAWVYIRRLWNLVLLFFGFRLAVYILFALLNPGKAFIKIQAFLPYQLVGGTYGLLDKYTSGLLVTILFYVALNRFLFELFIPKRVFWAGVMSFALGTLIFLQARISVIALAISVLMALFLYKRLLLAGFIALAMLALSIMFGSSFVHYFMRGQDTELFSSLTGRTEYWTAGWHMFLDSPLLGYGYYSGVRLDLKEIYPRVNLSTVDNTFLEVLINNGIIGWIPFSIAVFIVWRLLVRRLKYSFSQQDYVLAVEMIGVYTIYMIHSMLGPTIETFRLEMLSMFAIIPFTQLYHDSLRHENPSTS
jgi:O-antigen ligase